ncbi:MAG: hypothetical protein JWN69_1582 [Alphaproteobacteria bacterium]|nr:hypothetical protein [Alphaproteobacteria bacterium]
MESKRVAKAANQSNNSALAKVVAAMAKVPGVCAIGLGGSRSIGTADATSDYDVIIFTETDDSLDTAAVHETVVALGGLLKTSKRRPGEPLLGELAIDGAHLELFFRKISMIKTEIGSARNGRFSRVFNPLHVIGLISTITISYATYCLPIWDPEERLKRLIESAFPYPEALRIQMIKSFRTEAKTALTFAGKARSPDDVAHIAGLYARVTSAWNLVLFAANRRYPVIDKGGRRIVGNLPQSPADFTARTNAVFKAVGAGDFKGAFAQAQALHAEVLAIADASQSERIGDAAA